jgi:hypothetical protein
MVAPVVDLAEVLRPGHVLSEADVLALSAALEPPWKTRQRRQGRRADAIRVAMAATGAATRHGAACALSRAMKMREQGRRTETPTLDAAADAILALNGGRALGWRTLERETDVLA